MSDGGNTLISHLEALRSALLRIVAAVALLYLPSYFAAPYLIEWLSRWCFPSGQDLYYFSPMEAFWVQLKLSLAVSLILTYPWNVLQLWKFVLPALYPKERRALGGWILLSSLLFLCGGVFCIGCILPLLMEFSASFATSSLRPMIGLAGFLDMAGWLTLGFSLMFQTPIVVYAAVRMGLVSAAALANKRPFVVVAILILSALLTPPDVMSQLLLAAPTWLLFELGLVFARRAEKRRSAAEAGAAREGGNGK